MLELPVYTPYAHAELIRCPVLLVAVVEDNLCDIKGVEEVARKGPTTEVVRLNGSESLRQISHECRCLRRFRGSEPSALSRASVY